jgi:hypothetical protein
MITHPHLEVDRLFLASGLCSSFDLGKKMGRAFPPLCLQTLTAYISTQYNSLERLSP